MAVFRPPLYAHPLLAHPQPLLSASITTTSLWQGRCFTRQGDTRRVFKGTNKGEEEEASGEGEAVIVRCMGTGEADGGFGRGE